MSQRDYSKSSLLEKLSNILDTLPDGDLLKALQASTGRPGYGPRVLWRAYIASFVLNTTSLSAMLRTVNDDPRLTEIVGGTPTKFALSRFIKKLKDHADVLEKCMNQLTSNIKEFLPDLGEVVALDSSDIKAWSGWRRSDPDAASSMKLGTDGHRKWWYGYKLHLTSDTEYELPLTAHITPANTHDSTQLWPSIEQLSEFGFHPSHILADAGYDSQQNREIVEAYHAVPIIKRNRRRGTVQEPTREFMSIYSRRSSIERVFGRLKDFRRLNRLTLKGLAKATVHCLTSVLTLLAYALACLLLDQPDLIRCSV